jgi:hypothetical protein
MKIDQIDSTAKLKTTFLSDNTLPSIYTTIGGTGMIVSKQICGAISGGSTQNEAYTVIDT